MWAEQLNCKRQVIETALTRQSTQKRNDLTWQIYPSASLHCSLWASISLAFSSSKSSQKTLSHRIHVKPVHPFWWRQKDKASNCLIRETSDLLSSCPVGSARILSCLQTTKVQTLHIILATWLKIQVSSQPMIPIHAMQRLRSSDFAWTSRNTERSSSSSRTWKKLLGQDLLGFHQLAGLEPFVGVLGSLQAQCGSSPGTKSLHLSSPMLQQAC